MRDETMRSGPIWVGRMVNCDLVMKLVSRMVGSVSPYARPCPSGEKARPMRFALST